MNEKAQEKRTYTVERVALMLHVFPDLIIEAIEQGRLAAIKDGDSYVIPYESMVQVMKDGNPFLVKPTPEASLAATSN